MKTHNCFFLFAAISLFIFACFSPLSYKNEDTTLSVGFGGSSSRSVIPADLTYEISFSGPGRRTITETASWGETKTVQVVPGRWSISVRAFESATPGTIKAIGEVYNINVRAGRKNEADIKMAKYAEVSTWTELADEISADSYDIFFMINENITRNPGVPAVTIAHGRKITLAGNGIISSTGFTNTFFSVNGDLVIGSQRYSGTVFLNGSGADPIVTIGALGTVSMDSGSINNAGTGYGINNNGTFNMSGSAFVDEVYLAAGKTITVQGNLTGSGGASIRPASYAGGLDVLDGSSNLIMANRSKFSINNTGLLQWVINTAGKIYIRPFMDMVRIQAGEFDMGQENNPTVNLVCRVRLTQGFYMGSYQVTQEQYEAVIGSNPSNFTSNPFSGDDQGKRPVEQVSWYDALVFCNRLSMLEGLSPAYQIDGSTNPVVWGAVPVSTDPKWNAVEIVPGSNGYRLPTEAQWEYACRAGTTTIWNYGSTTNTAYMCVGTDRTREVGKMAYSLWGLFDMHGNVSEWCWDWYAPYQSGTHTNPTGPSNFFGAEVRIHRGGSWSSAGFYEASRSAHRESVAPYTRVSIIGFRIVRP